MIGDADQWFEKAIALVRAHNHAGAQSLLEQVVAAEPTHAASLHLLGWLAGRAGDQARCIALLSRAMDGRSREQALRAAVLLGASCRRWGRLEVAEAAYTRALSIDTGSLDAAFGLGLVLGAAGRDDEAAAALRRAIRIDPSFAPTHGALAAALLACGALVEAGAMAERANALAPDDAEFARTLAIIRNAEGRHGEAAALCRTALDRAGDHAGLLNTLGVALKEAGEADEAASCFRRALTREPASIEARFNLAQACKDQGRTDEAVALLREVVAAAPALAAARFALCMAHLPPIYASEAEIDARRAAYAQELDRLIAWADAHGAAGLADGVGAAQPFQLAYGGRDDVELQRRYGSLVCRAMAERFAPVPLAPPPRPGERIRIGIVSGHIRDHSVWRIPTRGWVAGLDRSRCHLACYHTAAPRDGETEAAEAMVDRFVQGPLPLVRWRELIAADRPHVLIYPEIGMDPAVAQLAALRLAPVQAASWGHPVTTGYPTIDLYLSGAAMEPEDADAHYTERLVRLSGLSAPVAIPPVPARAIDRTSLGLTEDTVVYWCAQSLSKYLPRYDGLYPAIAARVPNARFVFIDHPGGAGPTGQFRRRLRAAFAASGLDAAHHCLFLPRMDAAVFRGTLACADVVLDSPGWSGCNTLVEALAYGLPIVTMPGHTMRSRHGAALLRLFQREPTICADEREYVDVSVRLGEHRSRNSTIPRHGIRNVWPMDVRCLSEMEGIMQHYLQLTPNPVSVSTFSD